MHDGLDPEFLRLLACPAGHGALSSDARGLCCVAGCSYPVVDGVPVLLRADLPATIELALASLRCARGEPVSDPYDQPPWFVSSLGIDDAQRRGVLEMAAHGSPDVDPVIAYLVSATNGIAYRDAVGRLGAVPIPDLRLPPGQGAPCSMSAAVGGAG